MIQWLYQSQETFTVFKPLLRLSVGDHVSVSVVHFKLLFKEGFVYFIVTQKTSLQSIVLLSV